MGAIRRDWRIWTIVLIAAALRLPLVESASVDDDEIFSARDALLLFSDEPLTDSVKRYPVSFALERLSIEAFGLTPATLRLPAFLCGALAPLVLFLVGRRRIGDGPARLAALLVAVWPWHQYFSGNGRYYTPLFLAGAVGLAAAWNLRDRLIERIDGGPRPVWPAVVGFIAAVGLAAAVHPSGLLCGAGALVILAEPAVRRRIGAAGIAVALTTIAAAAWGLRASPYWRPIERVVSGHGGRGEDTLGFLQGLGLNVTPTLTAVFLVGAAASVASRGVAGRLLLTASLLPALLLVGFTIDGYAQPRYLLAASPAVLLLAGIGLHHLLDTTRGPLRTAVLLACLAPFVPSLASNLIDGNRHDMASVAAHLAPRIEEDEGLFAESHNTLRLVLHGFEDWRDEGRRHDGWPAPRHGAADPFVFGELPPSEAELETLRLRRRPFRFVITENDYERPPDRDYRRLTDWLRDVATLEARVGEVRYDYHRNALLVLRTGARRGG